MFWYELYGLCFVLLDLRKTCTQINGNKLRCTKCKNDPFAVFKAPCGVMFSLKCCQSVEKLLNCSVLDWRALTLLKSGVMSAAEWVDGRTSWEDAEQASYPSLVSGSLSDLGFCIFDFPPSNCSFYLNREKAIARSMNVDIYGVYRNNWLGTRNVFFFLRAVWR